MEASWMMPFRERSRKLDGNGELKTLARIVSTSGLPSYTWLVHSFGYTNRKVFAEYLEQQQPAAEVHNTRCGSWGRCQARGSLLHRVQSWRCASDHLQLLAADTSASHPAS